MNDENPYQSPEILSLPAPKHKSGSKLTIAISILQFIILGLIVIASLEVQNSIDIYLGSLPLVNNRVPGYSHIPVISKAICRLGAHDK
ncbi:MAG: hypothetical protein SFX18_02255 [Pirellulales bacterium]|nr:hypothetical protein [Pirellulales bacterium]